MGNKGRTPQTLKTLAPGVSLRQLSIRTGIALPHLSRIASGKRNLTIRTTRRIAEALALSMERVIEAFDVNRERRRAPSERVKRGTPCAAPGCKVRHDPRRYATRLHAHHPDANNPSHTVALCPDHHKAAHGGSFTNLATLVQ